MATEIMELKAWREVSNTAELDARVAFPIAVLIACWYDGQFAPSFVCEADYWGREFGERGHGGFGGRGGGHLGACVVTHWQPKPPPPPEADMLRIALAGVLSSGNRRSDPA